MAFGARGLFSCNSINIHINTDRIVAHGAYAKGLKIIQGSLGIKGWASNKGLDWRSMSEVERNSVLTLAHERDHFRLLVGTPVGLLMWRCNETLVADVALAMRALAALGLKQLPGNKSLLQWFRNDVEQFFGSVPEDGAALARQTREALRNIALLSEFRDVMFGEGRPASITVGEFLDLANRVYPYLCERWGLRQAPVWLAKHSARDDPIYPDREDGWAGTIPEIFEGSARLQERSLLDDAGADPAAIEAWERSHLTGIYRRSYRAFIHSFGSEGASFFAFLSLLSPIDPLCSSLDTLYIEDVLPHIRAARLSIAVSHRHELTAAQVRGMLQTGRADAWCLLAGLQPASETLRSFLHWSDAGVTSTPFFTPILRPIGPSQTESEPNENGSYIVVNLTKFDRGFRESLSRLRPELQATEKPDASANGGGTAVEPQDDAFADDDPYEDGPFFPVTPDIEFFRNTVNLGNYYKGADVYNYHLNMLHYVLSVVCLSLLQPFRPLEDPSPLVAAFIRRLADGLEHTEDQSPAWREFLRAAKADETTEEWRNIRAWWSDVRASNARIGEYLRRKVGETALRSVRFYPSDPGYTSRDGDAPDVQMSFAGLRDASPEELHSRIPRGQFDSQVNFANLLVERGENEGDSASLASALAAYQFALDATSRENAPWDWALLMFNMGHALSTLGARQGDDIMSGAAIHAFRAALEVRTRAADPLAWARTQRQLGQALIMLGERHSDRKILSEAIAAFNEALQESRRDTSPLEWARSKLGLGTALARLGESETGSVRLNQAVGAYRDALGELTVDRVPMEWATIQNNLGNVFKALGERETGTARLKEAASAYRNALTRQDRDHAPLEWAQTQHNLGAVLEMIGEREDETVALEASIAALRSALEIRTRKRLPLDWAASQNSLGAALETLGRREASTSRLEEAVAAYEAAISGAKGGHPVVLQLAMAGVQRTLAALAELRRGG